jgi:hypothetical protein
LSQIEIDFKKYKKFSWPDYRPLIKQSPRINPAVIDQISDAILKTLESKGYQFIPSSASADFIVSYALSSSNAKEYKSASQVEINSVDCLLPIFKPYSSANAVNQNDLYTEITISVFDVSRCQGVWQANVTTQFNPHNTNFNQNNEMLETVEELLKNFPKRK